MTFRQFTFNNVLRNKRLYAAFFLSSMFSVFVFFVYAIFAFHPALNGDLLPKAVATTLHVAEGIIYVFAFFFVLYSMSSFLKSREKEFGLLIMHGMTTTQLRMMIFLENLLIGFFSTISGILLGLAFAKAILLTAQNALKLEQTLAFYLPTNALLLTFGSFMLLFLLISFFTIFMVRSKKIVQLLKGSIAPRKEIKPSIIISILAILLLGAGYVGALTAKGTAVVMAFVPVTVVVIIATYFLFTQLIVLLVNSLRKRQSLFWKKTNLITFSDLAYRMKDNARTFFIVSIVSTVAFTAIGTLIGFKAMITKQAEVGLPFEIQYKYEANINDFDHGKQIKYINDLLAEKGIKATELSAQIHHFSNKDGGQSIALVRSSDYNKLAIERKMKTAELSGNQAILFHDSSFNLFGELDPSMLKQQQVGKTAISIEPVEHRERSAIPISRYFYVVSDEMFASAGSSDALFQYYMWNITSKDKLLETGKELSAHMEKVDAQRYFTSKTFEVHTIMQTYDVFMFIGLFVGIVFFVASASFLYLRLYQDMEEDKRKFGMITKLGLTDQEMSRVISRQMALLFFAPIIVALIHGAVALTALQNMFMSSILQESATVLGCFLGIQIVYFIIMRFYYVRGIKRSLLIK